MARATSSRNGGWSTASNVERLYTEVPRLWSKHVFSDHVASRLVRNAHGDSSGVRGAAWLWPPEEAP